MDQTERTTFLTVGALAACKTNQFRSGLPVLVKFMAGLVVLWQVQALDQLQ